MTSDNSYDVEGFSFPGIPFVLVGKNKFLSWAFNFNPNHQTEQIYVDSSLDLRSQVTNPRFSTLSLEQIRVYGLPEALDFPVFQVDQCRDIRGIVDPSIVSVALLGGYSHIFLCSKSFYQEFRGLSFFHRINFAKSAAELEIVVQESGMESMNLVFALNDGFVGIIESKSTEGNKKGIMSAKQLSSQKWKEDFLALCQRSNEMRHHPMRVTEDVIISSHQKHHQRIEQMLTTSDKSENENTKTCFAPNSDVTTELTCVEADSEDTSTQSRLIKPDRLDKILRDDFSSSALQTAAFMIRLIDNLSQNRYLLKFYTNFTEHNLAQLESIKDELILFDGSASLHTNALLYIQGFHAFFLMAIFKPLIPLEDVYFGNNATAILRRGCLDKYRYVGIFSLIVTA